MFVIKCAYINGLREKTSTNDNINNLVNYDNFGRKKGRKKL